MSLLTHPIDGITGNFFQTIFIDDGYSTYVLTDVVHPHGILSTPRSLLFGIDAEDDYKKQRDRAHPLKKAYWSQAHALYQGHFAQTDLFIIFRVLTWRK